MLAQHSVLKDLVIATVEVTAAAWIQGKEKEKENKDCEISKLSSSALKLT